MTDKNVLTNINSALQNSGEISIVVKKEPTLDAMAGALALYLALSRAGKKTSILCATPPIVELSNLVGIDKVSSKLISSGHDLTIVLPYEKGRIDKISYNIEGNNIHLVVKAGSEGLGFGEDEIKFLRTGGSTSDLIFLVDASTADDLSGLLNIKDIEGKKIVNIGKNESQIVTPGTMDFVDTQAASISELVAKLLSDIGAPLDKDSAQNLMHGINAATNNFQASNTSPLAFEMTGFLMRYGALRDIEKKEDIKEDKDLKENKVELTEDKKEEKRDEPPLDWLTPKIYKGSTLP